MVTQDEGERILEDTEKLLVKCIEDIADRATREMKPFLDQLTKIRAHRQKYVRILVTGEVLLHDHYKE